MTSTSHEFCFEYGNINYHKNVHEKAKWFWGHGVILRRTFFITVVSAMGDLLRAKARQLKVENNVQNKLFVLHIWN